MNEDERNYYNQLHETSRTYQITQWAVPGVFLALQGLVFQALKLSETNSFQDLFLHRNGAGLVLLFDGIFSILLWMQFVKIHLFGSLIHKKIDRIDSEIKHQSAEERIPLYSINPGKFLKQTVLEEVPVNFRQQFVIHVRVSNIVSWVMLIVTFTALVSGIFILV